MSNSQQTSPVQAQPDPIMRCCQKTDIRDCNCLWPRGSCQKPTNIFTHYAHQCPCESCQWIREATQEYAPDRLGSGSNSSSTIKNCTYAGNQLDEVLNTEKSQVPNDLDVVHPIMAAEGPPQEWKWVFRPTKQQQKEKRQIPYLADERQCPDTVMMATLDSNGRWKGIRRNEEPIPLVHTLPPKWNRLYRDYGYSRDYSPYKYCADEPRDSNILPCTPDPMVPANKLRRFSANESNTTLVVGSIDKSVSKDDLLWLFGGYGQIRYINRPDQTCAFIQFALRRDAMMAMRQLQGIPIYRNRFRISWGDPRVRNQDEFEAREGPLRFKGSRHQKPQQPTCMGKEREEAWRPQSQWPQSQWPQSQCPSNYPPQGPVVNYCVPPCPACGQVPAQQQIGCGYQGPMPPTQGFDPLPRTVGEAEPESEQTKPPSRPNIHAAPFTSEQKGKGRVVVVTSECVANPSGQSHNQNPQDTRTPSRESQNINGESSSQSSNRAVNGGSSTSGCTSPEEEAGPDEGARK